MRPKPKERELRYQDSEILSKIRWRLNDAAYVNIKTNLSTGVINVLYAASVYWPMGTFSLIDHGAEEYVESLVPEEAFADW